MLLNAVLSPQSYNLGLISSMYCSTCHSLLDTAAYDMYPFSMTIHLQCDFLGPSVLHLLKLECSQSLLFNFLFSHNLGVSFKCFLVCSQNLFTEFQKFSFHLTCLMNISEFTDPKSNSTSSHSLLLLQLIFSKTTTYFVFSEYNSQTHLTSFFPALIQSVRTYMNCSF